MSRDPMELVGRLEARAQYAVADPLIAEAAACIREMVEWLPLNTAVCNGRSFLVSAAGWDVGCIVDWASEEARDIDLHNWTDPPTHWLPLPPAPGAEDE